MSNSVSVEGVNKCLGHIAAGMQLRQLNEVQQCGHRLVMSNPSHQDVHEGSDGSAKSSNQVGRPGSQDMPVVSSGWSSQGEISEDLPAILPLNDALTSCAKI
jgi:hypothetical protein